MIESFTMLHLCSEATLPTGSAGHRAMQARSRKELHSVLKLPPQQLQQRTMGHDV